MNHLEFTAESAENAERTVFPASARSAAFAVRFPADAKKLMPGKQSLNDADVKALAAAPNIAPCANDASNYREGPNEVVVPKAIEDVAEARLLAVRRDAPATEAP